MAPEHRLYVAGRLHSREAGLGRSQSLAKIERGHETDRRDVAALVERGLVERGRLREYFDAIEPELFRFPAIDPPSFRRAVEQITG